MTDRRAIRLELEKVVGEAGFEPATPWPPAKCAAGLRYSPNQGPSLRQEGAAASLPGVTGNGAQPTTPNTRLDPERAPSPTRQASGTRPRTWRKE